MEKMKSRENFEKLLFISKSVAHDGYSTRKIDTYCVIQETHEWLFNETIDVVMINN